MKIIPIFIFVFFLFINPSKSEGKIVFIDLDKIILTSNPGSSILKQLNEINIINFTFFKNEEKKFKDKENKLISQKNIISEDNFKIKVNGLKSEIKNYNIKKNKMTKDFNRLKVNNTNNFLKLINPILTKFINEEDIDVVLQKKSIVIGKAKLDITEEVIKIINLEVKEFKIK
tara:strand:+ start:624 stop:1142 length:519 start_codon:yes stop_codon:yes gene_type:complete